MRWRDFAQANVECSPRIYLLATLTPCYEVVGGGDRVELTLDVGAVSLKFNDDKKQ